MIIGVALTARRTIEEIMEQITKKNMIPKERGKEKIEEMVKSSNEEVKKFRINLNM